MRQDEKTLWDRKYSEGSHRSLTPDPFLGSAYSEFIAGSKPGSALDVAGGIGRHALWLAERGWKVKLVDISEVGIDLARQSISRRSSRDGSTPTVANFVAAKNQVRKEARERLLPPAVETKVIDLRTKHGLGKTKFDLVLVFFYLQRSLFPALISALKPGGFLIYKTYTLDQRRFPRGPSHPMHLLKPNELLRAFARLRILHYHETVSDRGVAELVAQKKLVSR